MIDNFNDQLKRTGEVGYVEEIREPIIYVSGLPTVKPGETVLFESGGIGQTLGLGENNLEILTLFPKLPDIGTRITRSGDYIKVPVTTDLLGKIVDPLCTILNGEDKHLDSNEYRPIDSVPLGIKFRKRITVALETGVSVVDLLIPLGKGQRELVIGDRKTGKTSFLRQTVLNQAKKGLVCIYCAIAKKVADIKEIETYFSQQGVASKVVMVATFATDPAGLIFLSPYTAMTIAEYFRDQGQDVLVVLDDLTTHAKYYREISLVARRFPGRESYPGDIFYIHSRLLERAGNFDIAGREVSISCLPVAESIEADLTGYIQTNLMSMTDGHIFFDNDLFVKGRRPAINPFISVTRVGHQTQKQVRRDIYREVSTMLTLFEKSESYTHFSSDISLAMKVTLATGQRLVDFFSQSPGKNFPTNAQTILFALLWVDFWHGDNAKMKIDMDKLTILYFSQQKVHDYFDTLAQSGSFNELLGKIKDNQFLAGLVS